MTKDIPKVAISDYIYIYIYYMKKIGNSFNKTAFSVQTTFSPSSSPNEGLLKPKHFNVDFPS